VDNIMSIDFNKIKIAHTYKLDVRLFGLLEPDIISEFCLRCL
jgi:hypothetical protein